MLIMSGVRSLIKGIPYVDEFKDWTNWLLAACCGISTVWTNLDKIKKEESKEDKSRK